MATYYATASNSYIALDSPEAFVLSDDWGLVTNPRSQFIDRSLQYTSLPDYAFYNTRYLQDISFPALTSIGNSAFEQCVISKVSMPSLEYIGDYAFRSCTMLPSFTFAKTVSYIGSSAFLGISVLTSLTFNHTSSDTISFGTSVFHSKTARTATIYHYGNSAVLNYNWSNDKITPTFVDLR